MYERARLISQGPEISDAGALDLVSFGKTNELSPVDERRDEAGVDPDGASRLMVILYTFFGQNITRSALILAFS
jgi:hypothetical protein